MDKVYAVAYYDHAGGRGGHSMHPLVTIYTGCMYSSFDKAFMQAEKLAKSQVKTGITDIKFTNKQKMWDYYNTAPFNYGYGVIEISMDKPCYFYH